MKLTKKPHSTAPFSPRLLHCSTDLLLLKLNNNNNKRRNNGGTLNPMIKRVGSSGGKIQEKREEEEEDGDRRIRRRRRMQLKESEFVSARKLAAGLWRLGAPVPVKTIQRLGRQPSASHISAADHSGKTYVGDPRHSLPSPSSVFAGRNRFLCGLEPSHHFSNLAMEGATKWDPVCLEPSHEIRQIYSHMKRIDQQVSPVPIVTGLEAELEQARLCIQKLEGKHRSSKKKLERFMKKVGEERASWQSREHEKIRAFIDDVKADLNLERKNRQRLEIVNIKLVNELADAQVSGKRFMHDYEKERKARVLIEDVCNELAKEIAEDKAAVEMLKKESLRLREQAEEERKMLQIAEVWREERVQMKLIDAKVALEEKYSLMNKLVADLQNFLRSRNEATDLKEMREAETLLQAATSLNIQDLKDFKYKPPNPDDIFSVFEDVNFGEANERVVEQCATYSPASPASKVHTVSPQVDLVKKDADSRQSNTFVQNGDLEDDESEWETVSHLEDPGSSYSPEGSVPSVNNIHLNGNVSGSGTEWEENACNETPTQHLRKVSSIAKLWKSAPNNGETDKVIAVDGMNGRFSNGRKSNGSVPSPNQGSGKGGLSPVDAVEHWSSPPHITRRMKGCIEWPRGIQKTNLKSKLLEATMESQKVQMRRVRRQKI